MKLEDIKEGDYLFYTERPHSNYADSLIKVVSRDGILYPHTLTTNWKDFYAPREDDWNDVIAIHEYYDENCWYPTDYDGVEDPVAYMTREYPLNDDSVLKDLLKVFEKYEVTIKPQPKRIDGDWHVRYVWEIVTSSNTYKCDWEGFETLEEMLKDLIKTSKTIK